MKTDWHRYNLKRRVAELPSISSDVFAEKILQSQQAQDEEDEDEYGFHVSRRHRKGKQVLAVLENRGRNSDKLVVRRDDSPSHVSEFSAFSLGDSSHIPTDVETGSELNYTTTDSELPEFSDDDISEEEQPPSDHELEEVSLTLCLYCGHANTDIEANVKHMFGSHGLYVPERTYLTDLHGLLTFLAEIVYLDHECYVCGFEGKTLEGIRQHMVSKGHCRIPYETDDERSIIEEFYDFSSTELGPTKASTTKRVAFSDSLVLADGSKAGHRHEPRRLALVLQPRESERTVAIVDKRFAPGITSYEVARQQKQTQKLVTRAKNVYYRRAKAHRVNYQPHFRDEFLQ